MAFMELSQSQELSSKIFEFAHQDLIQPDLALEQIPDLLTIALA
jgi:hypothetical protein